MATSRTKATLTHVRTVATLVEETPIQRLLAGATAWYSADAIGGLVNGSNVSSWLDLTGKGHTLSQSTTINKPTYATNSINGLPTVHFSTSGGIGFQVLSSAGVVTPKSTLSIFLVQRSNVMGIAFRVMAFNGQPTGSPQNGLAIESCDPSGRRNLSHHGISAFLDGFGITSANEVWSCLTDGIAPTLWVNTVSKALTGSGVMTPPTTGGFSLGASDLAGSFVSDCDLGEVILFDKVLSTTDRQLIESYLMTKWAIPFDPSQISGCIAWYAAYAIDNITDGTTLQNWYDNSGAGHDLVQSTGASRPTYKVNIINGQPVVRFAGSHFMEADFTTVAQPLTIYAVRSTTDTASAQVTVGNATTSRTLDIDHFNGNNLLFAGFAINIGAINTSPHITGWFFNNTASYGRIDGVQSATATAGSGALTGGIRLGVDESSSFFFKGDIAEVIVYNKILSTAEITSVEHYLSVKYAIGSL